jgi:hypothetical protein
MDRVGFEPTTSQLSNTLQGGQLSFQSSLFDYPRAWTTTMKDCDEISRLMLLHTNQYEAKMRQKMLLAQAECLNAIS